MKDNITEQLAQLEKEFAAKRANLLGKVTGELLASLTEVLNIYEKFPADSRVGILANERFAPVLNSLGLAAGKTRKQKGKRKPMSEAGKKKIAAAQKKRWAERNAEKAATAQAA